GLKRFIQVEEKSFVAETSPRIIQRQVGAGRFVEQHAQTGSIARLKLLKEFSAHGVIARHQVTKDDAAEEFIGQDGKAQFALRIIEQGASKVLRRITPATPKRAVPRRSRQLHIGQDTGDEIRAPVPEGQYEFGCRGAQ